MFDELASIIAAFNDGANRGFWRIQLRDKIGQWAEMGRGLLSKVRMPDGSIQDQRGVYIGASERAGYGRQLVKEDDGNYYIYDIRPGNLEQFDATIPDEVLKQQGITKKARTPSRAEMSDPEIQDLADMNRRPATEADIKLATDVPDEGQKAIIKAEREKSPLAKLPAGAESKMSDDELKNLIESPTAEEAAPEAPVKSSPKIERASKAWLNSPSRENGDPVFLTFSGRDKVVEAWVGDDGGVYTGDVDNPSNFIGYADEIFESMKSGRGVQGIYKGKPPLATDENGKLKLATKMDILRMERESDAEKSAKKADAVAKAAFEKASAGSPPTIDQMIEEQNSPVMNDALDDIDLDDIEFFDEDTAPEPAPTPEVVEKPTAKVKPAVVKPKPVDTEPVEPEAVEIPTERTTPSLPEVDTPEKEEPNPAPEVEPAKSKVSMEELDAMGTPEEYINDFGGFTPSQEQTRALNAIVKGKMSVVIDALAGAGKTTTLIAAARGIGRTRPDEGVLIITFNKKNADEARAKSPKENTDGRTSHAIAFQALNPVQQKILSKPNAAAVISRDSGDASKPGVVEYLGLEDTLVNGENQTAEEVAEIIQKAIVNFTNSADKTIEQKHFDSAIVDLGNPDVEHEFNPKLLEYANKFWEDITSDKKIGYYDKNTKKFVGNRRLRVTHDHSLKMWSLSEPDLSKLMVRGKPVKVVFFDEAQDTNPAVAKVIKANNQTVAQANKGKVQIAYVGDPNQAIYGFRGAENAIDDAKIDVDAVVDLTMTRRFGDGLTAPGNAFLNLIGARRRVKGVGSGGEVLSQEELPTGPNRAHLVRTNSGGVEAILGYLESGKNVGVLSVFYEDVSKAVYHLKWMGSPFETVDENGKKVKRSRAPEDPQGNEAWSEDFYGMSKMADFYKKARKDSSSKAAKWLKLLDKIEASDDNLTEKLEQMLEQIVVDRSDQPAYGGDFSGGIGTDGILWSSKSGKNLEYSVDEDGVLKLGGNASFEKIGGTLIKDLLKERGFKFFGMDRGHDNTWRMPLLDDQVRIEVATEILSILPVEAEENKKIPDVVISTAHRSKGLEWDYVSIGDDFFAPKVSLESGKLVMPGKDELKLSYVALTRARKALSVGSLEWGMEYQGRDGLAKANDLYERPAGSGEDAWDYHEKQSASPSTPSSGEQVMNDLTDLDYDNIMFFDEDSVPADSNEAPSEIGAPPSFLDGWAQTQGGDYSKNVDGFRWSIKENKDGTATVRPRTDPGLGTTKYPSMEDAIKAFPELSKKGSESNRKKLKQTVAPFDESGEIQKAIDEGKSADDINTLIQKSDAWIQAIDEGKANFLSLRAGLERVGNGNVEINNPKTKKPKDVSKKKINPVPPTPQDTTSFYDNNPDRQDDGSDVGRFSVDEKTMKRLRGAKTTDEIRKAALLVNPQAKIKPDGSIVMYRGTHEETIGPAAGKTRILEISFKDNRDSSATVITKVTDPETGISQEYWHYQPRHSFAAIIGDEKVESAGIQRLLAEGFFRDPATNPFSRKSASKNLQLIDRFGGIEGFIAKSRSANLSKIMSDKKSDDSAYKLRTPQEHVALALGGRDRRLNNSLKNWWTQKRKERPSVFEALDNNDSTFAAALFRAYQNSIPDTKEARAVVEKYLTSSIAKKFPKVRGSQIKSMLSNALSQVKSELPQTGLPIRPHMTRDGIHIKGGDVVQWTDNNGGTVVGQVSYLQRIENPDDGKYSYSDYAVVTFADGTSERLNTSNMTFAASAEDVAGDPNMLEDLLTDYSGWVRRDDLKIARAQEAGFTFDPETGNILDADNNIVDTLGKFNDNSVYSDEEDDNTDSLDEVATKSVDDLQAGETLVDTETEEEIGKVASIKTGKLPDGRQITVVFLEDGSNKKYLSGDEVSVSSSTPSNKPAPAEPVRPVRTPKGPAAEEAAALELGTPPGEKPKKTLSKNSSADDSAKTPIKGDPSRKALKPTQEATDAKNKMLEAGAKAWELAKPKIIEKLRAAGYDVSSGDYNDLVKQDADNYTKSSKAKDKAQLALDKYEEKFGKDTTAKHQQLEEAATAAAIEFEKVQARSKNLNGQIKIAERDATLEVMDDLGIKRNNVSIAEFDGRVLTDEAELPIGPNDQFISAVALREAFKFMPENIIRGMAQNLKDNNLKLFVKAGVERGHFKKVEGGYEIVLSTHRKGSAAPDVTPATDVALHELWHFVQKTDPNLRQLEDAWTYDRVAIGRGTADETMPNIMSLDKAGREKTFATPGVAQPYMLKQYAEGDNFLDGNDGHSEVATVLMQDMFTSPGFASRGSGLNALVKDPETKKVSTVKGVYYDPETGMYYEDSSMSNPIDNVVGSFGRDASEGTDTDIKSLGMGLMLALSDWDPLTGFGPGNAVVVEDEEN